MKIFYHMSEAEFLHWQEELVQVYDDLRHALIPLNRENILTEQEACEVLGVTSRTLRSYRQKKFIGYIKLDGRIIYLKHWLYLDLEALYFKSKEKDE